ncbi:hypothetical protein LMTR3_30295 [Bradyrhizobium sp. LMTR 3]|nr:hypothetical protein LMTR3_30295 [Bradyrhizobium sp. LMTR 3]
MLPDLRFKKGLPDPAADSRRKSLRVLSAGAHENRRFDSAEQILHATMVKCFQSALRSIELQRRESRQPRYDERMETAGFSFRCSGMTCDVVA